ncbi:MAG: hypothetical protein KAQ87_00900 [Candidatus Pacebacteria bacterium]|nr:hypothetical protein [Candidatus Paceibacterota bacterium]
MKNIKEAEAIGCNDTELCIKGKGYPGMESKGENNIGEWCHKGKRSCGFLVWKRNTSKR